MIFQHSHVYTIICLIVVNIFVGDFYTDFTQIVSNGVYPISIILHSLLQYSCNTIMSHFLKQKSLIIKILIYFMNI